MHDTFLRHTSLIMNFIELQMKSTKKCIVMKIRHSKLFESGHSDSMVGNHDVSNKHCMKRIEVDHNLRTPEYKALK
jgi:hypothetical protein